MKKTYKQIRKIFKKDRYVVLSSLVLSFAILFSVIALQGINITDKEVEASSVMDIYDVVYPGFSGTELAIYMNKSYNGSALMRTLSPNGVYPENCNYPTEESALSIIGGEVLTGEYSYSDYVYNFCMQLESAGGSFLRIADGENVKVSKIRFRAGEYKMNFLLRNDTNNTSDVQIWLEDPTNISNKHFLFNTQINSNSWAPYTFDPIYDPMSASPSFTITAAEEAEYNVVAYVSGNYVDFGMLLIDVIDLDDHGPTIETATKSANNSLAWASTNNSLDYDIHFEMNNNAFGGLSDVIVKDLFDSNFVDNLTVNYISCSSGVAGTCSMPSGTVNLECAINNLNNNDVCDISLTAELKDPCLYNPGLCTYLLENTANIYDSTESVLLYNTNTTETHVYAGSGSLMTTQNVHHVNGNCTGIASTSINIAGEPYNNINTCYLSSSEPNVKAVVFDVPVTWAVPQTLGATLLEDVQLVSNFASNVMQLKRVILDGNIVNFSGDINTGFTISIGDMLTNPLDETKSLLLFYEIQPTSGIVEYDHYVNAHGYINNDPNDVVNAAQTEKDLTIITDSSTGGYNIHVSHDKILPLCDSITNGFECSYADLVANGETTVEYTFDWSRTGSVPTDFTVSTQLPVSDFTMTSYESVYPAYTSKLWNGQGYDYTFSTNDTNGSIKVRMDIPTLTNDVSTITEATIVSSSATDSEILNVLAEKIVLEKSGPSFVVYDVLNNYIEYTISLENISDTLVSGIIINDDISITGTGTATINNIPTLNGFINNDPSICTYTGTTVDCGSGISLDLPANTTGTIIYRADLSMPSTDYVVQNDIFVDYEGRQIEDHLTTTVSYNPSNINTATISIEIQDLSTNDPYYQIPGTVPVINDVANGQDYNSWQTPNAYMQLTLNPGTYNFIFTSANFFDTNYMIVDGSNKVVTVDSAGNANMTEVVFKVQALNTSVSTGDILVEVKEIFNGSVNTYSGTAPLYVGIDNIDTLTLSSSTSYTDTYYNASAGSHNLVLSGLPAEYEVVQGGITQIVTVNGNQTAFVQYLVQLKQAELTVRVFDVTGGGYIPYTGSHNQHILMKELISLLN